MITQITDANYGEILAQGKPMVIDFSAEWCGPCRKMAPVVEALAEKYQEQVTISSCDVDDNSELTTQYGIRNIPAIIFIKDGQVVDKIIGAVPASQVEEKIQNLLK